MIQTKQWVLNEYPTGVPTTAGEKSTFTQIETTLPPLQDGWVLLKTTHFSNDPAQRGWILRWEAKDESRMSVPPVPKGEAMKSFALMEVVESRANHLNKGDLVSSVGRWTQYSVQSGEGLEALLPLPHGLPMTLYMGALGLSGFTAYHGLVDAGRVTADDVVVISSAAGATGSMAVQIAKKIMFVTSPLGSIHCQNSGHSKPGSMWASH